MNSKIIIPKSISIEESINKLNRKTSYENMIMYHNDLLIQFFIILKDLEKENKKSKFCSIQ